jgi:2-hydroxychromene-2-carboxylate isomerase
MAAMPETVVAYFDYLCPYAWRGAEVARMVEGRLGLRFEWRHFSLYQSDHGDAHGWQLWNAKLDGDDPMGNRGLQPFLASCAARRQGPAAFDRFRLGLLRARHVHGLPLTRPTHLAVAEAAGLQLARFEADLADPELRTCLAQEHHQAARRDVFGTPTFELANGHLAYFRVRELPTDEDEAVRLFVAFRDLLEGFPYLETVRRPRPLRN